MDTDIIKTLLNKNMIEQCFIFTNVHQDTCTMYAETLHLLNFDLKRNIKHGKFSNSTITAFV